MATLHSRSALPATGRLMQSLEDDFASNTSMRSVHHLRNKAFLMDPSPSQLQATPGIIWADMLYAHVPPLCIMRENGPRQVYKLPSGNYARLGPRVFRTASICTGSLNWETMIQRVCTVRIVFISQLMQQPRKKGSSLVIACKIKIKDQHCSPSSKADLSQQSHVGSNGFLSCFSSHAADVQLNLTRIKFCKGGKCQKSQWCLWSWYPTVGEAPGYVSSTKQEKFLLKYTITMFVQEDYGL